MHRNFARSFFLFCGILFLCLMLWAATRLPLLSGKPSPAMAPSSPVASRHLRLGPVGGGITILEGFGKADLRITIASLYFEKEKVFGFHSNLFKRLIAKSVAVSIKENNRIVFKATAENGYAKSGGDAIFLLSPRIETSEKTEVPIKTLAIYRKKHKIMAIKKDGSTSTLYPAP